MLVKKIAITAAAGALLLSSAAGVFADRGHDRSGSITNTTTTTKTVTVTRADVNNFAAIHNNVVTVSNTGANFTMASGATSANATSGEAEKGGRLGNTTGGSAVGAGNSVTTGSAYAGSVVSNTVNTTVIRQ